MCRAILATDKRFSEVNPRHPHGGPDGGRDIQAIFTGEQVAFGAVGFVNHANDSDEQKKKIKDKFCSDLESALKAKNDLEVFVFMTNVNLTLGEKNKLAEVGLATNLKHCEIFDRERLRLSLDSPFGLAIRFQYLNLPLSEAEQSSFFAQWGDEIQSVISTGFQKIEKTLDRMLFLQESEEPLRYFNVLFEFDRVYDADEIGHFRLFCSMFLKEPKNNVWQLFFGSSDKPSRMVDGDKDEEEPSGIKYGISGGQWEKNLEVGGEAKECHYTKVGSSSSIGHNKVERLIISHNKDSFIRFKPCYSVRDLDNAKFIFMLNKSLAEKVCFIRIYSNGYKIRELGKEDFSIDETPFDSSAPVCFSEEEISDQWVRIRPSSGSSCFDIDYSEFTPKRLYTPKVVLGNLIGEE